MSRANDDYTSFADSALGYSDLLYTYALTTTGDPKVAGTLVEQVCVRAFHHWRQRRGNMDIRVWVLKELRSQMKGGWLRQMAAPFVRGSGHEQESMAITGCVSEESTVQEERELGWVSEESITRAIRLLPEEYRTAIILCDIGDVSYREIALVLECSVEEVSERLLAARKWLHENLVRRRDIMQELISSTALTDAVIDEQLELLLAKAKEGLK